MRPRILLLHIVLAACIGAAWVAGGLTMLVGADRVYAIPICAAVVLLAIAFGCAGKWRETEWIADKLPILGLIGTVIGLLMVLPAVRSGADSHVVNAELIGSLVSNLLGIAAYGWLELVRRVCEE